MAGRGPGTTATASGPCSGGQSDPASEATRKPLKDAWDKNWTNLTQNGQSAQKGVIPDEVKSKMARMFKELEDYMDWSKATGRAPGACAGLNGGSKQGTYQMKNICKVLVQVVYWMGNLDKNENKSSNTVEQDWEKYLRCAIGNGIILRILLPKCKVEKFMEVISEVMRKGGSQNKASSVGSICDWVKMDDMREMEELIGDEVQQFLNKAKQDSGLGKIEGVNNVVAWFRCTDEEKTKEGNQEKTCSSDRIIDFLPAGLSKELNVLVDPLEKAKDCIQRNIDNNSNAASSGSVPSMGKLCNRLSCIETYLKTTARTAAAAAGTGKTTPTDALWNDVQTQVTELVTNISANGGENDDTDGLCNDITCPNGSADCVSKTACNIMVKALKGVHTKGAGDQGDYQIFHPTMRCVILNVLGEKLKQHAKQDGYSCSVEEGIKKAFEVGKDNHEKWCTNNGKEAGSCEECKEQKCFISKIGGQEVWTKVWGMLNDTNTNTNTNTNKIQTTLDKIKKEATLCDRLNCAINQWEKTTGRTPGSSNEEFWKENGPLKTLWDELAGAMTANNGQENEECKKLDSPSEKWACKYLHAGLDGLYKNDTTTTSSSSSSVLSNPSFRQTMGCFLLHAYAKYMKGKAICNIEKGITKAFELGRTLSSGATCQNGGANGKGPCVPCQWQENILSTCKINTNGSTTPDSNVENKLKDIFKDDNKDPNISTMLSNINKRDKLCDHMKCIATHLNSTDGQQKSFGTTAEEFWTKDVKNLWNELVKEMKTKGNVDGSGNGDCKGFDNPSAERACNYLHVAFKKLEELSSSIKKDGNEYPTLKKDPSFVQTVGCFLLHSYAKHMEKKSTCVITAGIEKAFGTAGNNANNVPCQWNKSDYEGCKINTNGTSGQGEEVKPKVEDIVNNDEPNTDSIIKNINKIEKLCDGLKCIASHLNSSTSKYNTTASTFWTEGGEVGELWTQLSEAMLQNVDKENGGPCDRMKEGTTGSTANNTRDATNPEKKACNYFHGGLTELYKKNGATAPSASSANDTKLLSNPLLRQTVGCFLLKEYAKQIEKKTTCLIDSGLKKAFEVEGKCTDGSNPCIECKWDDKVDNCNVTFGSTTEKVEEKVNPILMSNDQNIESVTEHMNEMITLCDQLKCAAPNWFKKHSNGSTGNTTPTKTWCQFWEEGVRTTLTELFSKIDSEGKTKKNGICTNFGDGNEHSVERKACNHITAGLQHIKEISVTAGQPNGQDNPLLARAVGCIALNMYADKIIELTKKSCPIDKERIKEMFNKWNSESKNSCQNSANNNDCFQCKREESYNGCQLSVGDALLATSQNENCNTNAKDAVKVKEQMNKFLNESNDPPHSIPKVKETLSTINKMDDNFCTQLQCAAKKYYVKRNHGAKSSDVSWNALSDEIGRELTALLINMNDPKKQSAAAQYCNDANVAWNTKGHTERRTNKAACLHFAAGLKHIYGRPNGQKKGQFNGPSFGQTMGCLFLKEYAKQLKEMANVKKRGNSWVHPLCSIEEGITYAFGKSDAIMKNVLTQCNNGPNGISCFVCTQNENDYKDCSIGTEEVKPKVESLIKDEPNKDHMEKTLENTVCPILITDLLTPFLPLAPVSIGLSPMAYYLWKYFGPLGKGGARFRRSPGEIPGPSVQEQVLDHVEEAGPHEYRLVKERKPRSVPTRTKRSGRVNRRTIIEIHFEVLDECQKGDTQLNQKDFMELLVQEFMGSEFMEEEEQVPKEEVLMEDVPLERVSIEEVPMERVPSLGSGLMV
ncbi:SICAvar, type I (fragment) [Plasmodium knowlesi strain H]|uniref:SICAvar, type I n=1 Tax=Plasmodium knowlesi (strain H) TaxID=5851 RepID=A0A1A7W3B1_PLAKH